MSLPIEMAEAVLQKIKDAFPEIASERQFVASLELKDTKEPRIIVVPKEISYERASRSHNSVQVAVDVALMKKFHKGDAAELDPLCDLVEKILKLFDGKPLGDALCLKAQNRAYGRVNGYPFRGFAADEVRFLGVSGSYKGSERWVELTYRFAISPNMQGLWVGDIGPIWKPGWAYVWVRYEDQTDTNLGALVKRPVGAYVEQVYPYLNFASLGIGW